MKTTFTQLALLSSTLLLPFASATPGIKDEICSFVPASFRSACEKGIGTVESTAGSAAVRRATTHQDGGWSDANQQHCDKYPNDETCKKMKELHDKCTKHENAPDCHEACKYARALPWCMTNPGRPT